MNRIIRVVLVALIAAAGAVGTHGTQATFADQNCLGWERALHVGADGRSRPAVDRLDGERPYGQVLGDWVADNCMRLNYVQVVGTHNSYHVQPRDPLLQFIASLSPEQAAAIEYTHRPLGEQLDVLDVRQFELDVYVDPVPGMFALPLGQLIFPLNPPVPDPIKPELLTSGLKVLHVPDADFEATCLTFVACLQSLEDWSDANPGHLPIMVLVEAKDDPAPIPPGVLPPGLPLPVTPVPFGVDELDRIDAEIRSVFSDDQLLTPDDVRAGRATLEAAVLIDGWPTLNETRGRFLFALDNEDATRDLYIAGHPSLERRVLFTSSPPGTPEAAFVKINDPITNGAEITSLVAAGYIVRTRADADTIEARFGLTSRRDAALASGAQFVSTDYPEPNPDFGTGYFVDLGGASVARCNPVLSPPGCDASTFEH